MHRCRWLIGRFGQICPRFERMGPKKFAAGVGQIQCIAVCNGVCDFSNYIAGSLKSAEFFVFCDTWAIFW
jgi:hypothetical protein